MLYSSPILNYEMPKTQNIYGIRICPKIKSQKYKTINMITTISNS